MKSADTGARLRVAYVALIAIALGCGFAPAPLRNTPSIVATPQPGQLSITSQSKPAVGSVVPVYVSVANGTDVPRAVVPSQVFALDENGDRVAPLPPGEAARQSGNAGQLKAALTSAAISGVGLGAAGAAVGAIAGSVLGSGATGAAVGGAIGAGEGVIGGAPAGMQEAKSQANQQIGALALQGGDVGKDFTVSGYVFFPQGSYKEIELLLVNRETGDTETIKQPWR